uniref:Uncharacterized protein n=1 Tax=Ditylenchus dipsaci TaxID=166011 RepID=A0A915CUB8_9BILA
MFVKTVDDQYLAPVFKSRDEISDTILETEVKEEVKGGDAVDFPVTDDQTGRKYMGINLSVASPDKNVNSGLSGEKAKNPSKCHQVSTEVGDRLTAGASTSSEEVEQDMILEEKWSLEEDDVILSIHFWNWNGDHKFSNQQLFDMMATGAMLPSKIGQKSAVIRRLNVREEAAKILYDVATKKLSKSTSKNKPNEDDDSTSASDIVVKLTNSIIGLPVLKKSHDK